MSDQLLILSLIAKEFGVLQNYLRFLIFKKKLRGVKVGRNWYTTREWLTEYFSSIEPRKVINGITFGESPETLTASKGELHALPAVEQRLGEITENLSKIQQSLASIAEHISPSEKITAKFRKQQEEDSQESEKKILSPVLIKESASMRHTLRPALVFLFLFALATILYSSLSHFSFPRALNSFSKNYADVIEKLGFTFSAPLSPPSEIPIPRKPQINAEKPYEVESRFSGISKEAKPQEAVSQTINEIVQHREVFIPADTTLVKKEILTDVETLNKSLRGIFENAINDLTLKLSRTTVSTDSNTRIITLTQKIDQLSNTTLSSATFQGTANQFNLKDTDIPDDITVTGAISPTQLTVSNTLTVQGTGTSTYSGGIQALSLNITSSTATSTFSNGIQLGGGALKTVREIV